MKTLAEVITGLDICKNFSYCTHPEKGECPYLQEDYSCGQDDLYRDALHYLKMYRSDMQMYAENQKYWEDELKQKIKDFGDAKDRYIKRLKELDIGTLNNPLSWEELKAMEGKPVWTVESTVTYDDNGIERIGRWNIIREVTQEHIIFYIGLPYHKSWQGIGWQAYRKERG